MDIKDNNAEDRNEEALLELDRINSEREKELLQDKKEEYNPKFQQPVTEEAGDLTPITQKEQAQKQTSGLNQFASLRQWRDMEEGEEKEALKANWFRTYYNMTPQEYRDSNFFQHVGAGWKNQQAGWGNTSGIASAVGIGAIDFAGDVLGNIHPTLGAMDDWWDRKTRFNNPAMQKWRQVGNIVIPSMVGSGAVLNATRGQNMIVQGSALLGIDLAVTGLSDMQTDDESITKTLVEAAPGQFGPNGRTPLPQALVTQDHMSSGNRKLIHMLEAAPFSIIGNALGFVFSRGKPKLEWFEPLDKQAKKYKALEIARSADNQINIRIAEIDQIIKTKPNAKDIRILKEERKRLVNQLAENRRFDKYVENTEDSKAIQS